MEQRLTKLKSEDKSNALLTSIQSEIDSIIPEGRWTLNSLKPIDGKICISDFPFNEVIRPAQRLSALLYNTVSLHPNLGLPLVVLIYQLCSALRQMRRTE